MSNWRVVRFIAGGELRFRLEDVMPEHERKRCEEWRGGRVSAFIDHDDSMGFASPDDIRKDLLERLKALKRPHVYVEPERVVEVNKK